MPAITSTFRSNEPSLSEVLRKIHEGVIQLPDFQRGWVWDEDHIRSLLASISLSYPVGAIMQLETGGDGVRFQPRLIAGVELAHPVEPDFLILDGQQRMTSLYLSLRSGKPVMTKNKQGPIERYFYLKIADCLNDDIERMDAVLAIPVDRKVKSNIGRNVDLDLSTAELEYEHGCFPLEVIFDQERYNAWRRGYQRKYRNDETRLDEFDDFESKVLKRFNDYRVPSIELLKDTPKEAVCQVFEKVNTGGVTLTVFELVTAIFATDSHNLRKDWEARQRRLSKQKVLREFEATGFLTACTLLARYRRHLIGGPAVACKKKDVLTLQLEDYKSVADDIEHGLFKVARLLAREKIFDDSNLPYSTQLIPLSAICAQLGDRFEEDPVRKKLTRWFWSGVFGELYGGANEGRYAFDLPDVIGWISGGEEPRTVRDANFDPTRLLGLQTRNSAAYKGVYALLMKAGCMDFINSDPIEITNYFERHIDVHHIFPASYCEKQSYPRRKWNSVINKTPLSARTNRMIGGRAPSLYIGTLEGDAHKISGERVDELIKSHHVTPELLRSDDFDAFIRDRARQLLDLIGAAMGKTVTGRDSEEVIRVYGGPLVAPSAASTEGDS
jgi:hypothetical protein